MNLRRLLLVLLAALFAASIKTAPAQSPSSSMPQIAARRHEWVNDWKSKNLGGLRTLYAQDAVFFTSRWNLG